MSKMFGRANGYHEQLLERPMEQPTVAKLPGAVRRTAEAPSTKTFNAKTFNANSSNSNSSKAAAVTNKSSDGQQTEEYYNTKKQLFDALIEIIDVSQLTKMNVTRAREEISDVVSEIVIVKKLVMSTAEQRVLLEDICNDVLGYGPLEPLLARDDIADIMVNGSNRIFIEVDGKLQQTDIRFRDNAQLINVCQRIVSQVGRRVDESSPICDARLPDGSRVNVIVSPLAIDGAALTIRKFKKDKLTLDQLVKLGAISPEGAQTSSRSSAGCAATS